MPETQRSRSPLLKSLSSKDLRSKTQARPPFAKQLSNEHQTFPSDTSLFHDLDSLLSKKLHLGDSNELQHENNGTDRQSNEANNSSEIIDTQDDANGEEDDEDSEFANVDEIDGPISPSSSSGSLKDYFQGYDSYTNGQASPKQLRKVSPELNDKDKIITYEDVKVEEDNNLPVDDALKKLLQEKADEIERGDLSHSFTKPTLDWQASDFNSLFHELSEWFIQKDYGSLKTAKLSFEKNYDSSKFIEERKYAIQVITELGKKLEVNSVDINTLLCLAYISFGTFQETNSYFHHLDILRRNNTLLMMISKVLLPCFKKHADCCRVKNTNLQQYNTLLFYSGSITYFMINIAIEQRSMHTKAVEDFIDVVHSSGLMLFLTKYIDHWRWKSRLSMRIRNIIILFHKVLLLQFGEESHYDAVKRFVLQHHKIEKKDSSASNLSISPLEYVAFREDITSRFPSSQLPEPTYPSMLDNPNSLSQFLEIPRPRSRSSSNMSLGEPQVHMATPAPSQPASPTSSPNGLKTRKSFQANLSYPAFFPSSGDYDTGVVDELSNKLSIAVPETVLPYNMQEAIEILSKSVHIKLSTKQLWHERELFMVQERGWTNTEVHEKDPFTYRGIQNEEPETMNRIEDYYANALPHFSSLVYVLLETIETCMSNKVYLEEDFSEEEINELQPQLELIRSKEIAMESSSAILFLLLKWFKVSHFLKFEYLCSLIYDSKFITTSVGILQSFTDQYQNRIYSKHLQPTHSFWSECSLYNVQYKETLEISTANEKANRLNLRMLNSEVYLLRVLSKITGKKTQRLKDLPLNVSNIFKALYSIFNLDIYHPILKIIHELAPFKNKRWRADHMELISGVFLHEKLHLTDNWITGKDITGEINDSYGQEIALRAMLQFYNFYHYKRTMEHCGYDDKFSNSFFSREAELLSAPY
ncbi:Far11p [Kluyveromyces lactis]|uniref:KLLA0F24244p n=1 Tax=Kluyveromyces lactis (strain ATCC 8585 / CBS 2359 / DSM 70799 / NBRC 1267 / NRRL Y-1140 / WM37) TaxID=284590 RepID=Q6CIS9_KLULA|nr:uncharacterized protein KLLA0_F24244g [Kluyveromyces lactis]CAG98868.1 KLLA0F24244p [Kluyveromyces lactis]|eukprot:XP_456160.1 uncharacterized protein KLLA0_F24244g [Kluyveromyces lactis]